ncbi:rRNA-processing protein bfr2 [Coemansia sp. Benny D160-2]|nr:rRNA-processing protein bfr2 [Coemansia sp. Benny D160-2]
MPKEFDIEDEGVNDNAYIGRESGSESDDNGDEELRREHYVDMGKSALRQRQGLGDLGPKYTGSQVTRKALYDDEESSDDSLSEEGEESLSDDNSDADELLESADNSGQSETEDESDEEQDDQDSDSDSENDMARAKFTLQHNDDDDAIASKSQQRVREEIKKLEEGEKALLKSITQTAKSDIEKGQHVLNQTRLWEGALDARIRVQKVITAANELPQCDDFDELVGSRFEDEAEPEESNCLEEARQSIRLLLGSLVDLRKTLVDQNESVSNSQKAAKAGTKRLASELTGDEEDEVVATWNELEELRSGFKPYRNESLEKWSDKVQMSANVSNIKKFKAVNQGIMHQLEQILAAKDRLVERTQLKRAEYKIIGKSEASSEAEGEESQKKNSSVAVDAHLKDIDMEIFDDTDFYQQLLRELIESRMVDSTDPTGSLGVRWAAVKQQSRSKKRVIDRGASKDRKIRYQVMEKIQNFMPPIPAGTWHEDMVNELFSTLLGQKVPQSILDADTENAAGVSKSASVTESLINSGEIDISDTQGLRLFG